MLDIKLKKKKKKLRGNSGIFIFLIPLKGGPSLIRNWLWT